MLCCTWAGLSSAADFYTIIGPDGRPMIIQHKESESSQKQSKGVLPDSRPKQLQAPQPVASDAGQVRTEQKVQKVLPTPLKQGGADESRTSKQVDQSALSSVKAEEILPSVQASSTKKPIESVVNTEKIQAARVENPQIYSQPDVLLDSDHEILAENSSKKTITKAMKPLPQNAIDNKPRIKADDSKFSEIDGVQYVDNEYLEEKEFNLEGKKRFYIMSEAGVAGGRQFETVEREKGITKSVFSKFLKNTNTPQKPIVLASTYFRLPKEEVVQNLEQGCFSGKKIQKAKSLSLDNDEIGFWPVAPIKENFAYEVVKLDPQVENIHLSSYASSQKNPTYYWPLVVFLDPQGCVIEGVSGFKSEDVVENYRQFSSLVGVLKKPQQASYLFMTPLAESIDVKNEKLSNTGQIKLSVLK